MPLRVPMKISPLPSVTCTAMTASPVLDAHRDDAAGARVAERRQRRLLDDAAARAHDDELVVLELLRPPASRRSSRLPPSRRRLAIDLPLPPGPTSGNLVDLQPVRAAAVREDHDVGVRRGDEQVADEVLVARPHADAALAAAPLVAIGRDRRPLDVAGVADRDRHVFFGDQVLDARSRRIRPR